MPQPAAPCEEVSRFLASNRAPETTFFSDPSSAGDSTHRIWISSSVETRQLVHALSSAHATQVLGKTLNLETDLPVTVHKLVGRPADGLEHYLGPERARHTFSVRSSDAREQALTAASAFFQPFELNPRLRDLSAVVLDELLSNALYNAPTDETGARRYAHLHREEQVELDGAPVQVELAISRRRLGVSVTDRFGSLSRATVLAALERCARRGVDQIERKNGGAGLGLYFVLESVSHLVVNLRPGRSTEMIGLIDIDAGYREFRRRPKSLTLFEWPVA